MMNKHKNTQNRWTYLLVFPVLLSVVFAFSSKDAISPIEEVGLELADRLGPVNTFDLPDFTISKDTSEPEEDPNVPSILPIKSQRSMRLTSGFGMRMDPISKTEKRHSGADFACAIGTEIVSTADGIVEVAEVRKRYGGLIIVDHGNGFKTRYAQLSEFKSKPGDMVEKGQVIALSGNSGRSTGPHLHYEVQKDGNRIDPMDYIKNYQPVPVGVGGFNGSDTSITEAVRQKEMLVKEEAERAALKRKLAEQESKLLKLREEEALLRRQESALRKEEELKAKEKELLQASEQNLRLLDIVGSKGKDPLYVVDGKEVSEVSELNPSDIAEVTVLKGDAAAKKYGKKGKDGVVEIRTKKKSQIKKKSQRKNISQAFRIIIDAGHGGKDAGALLDHGHSEKEEVLAIALGVSEALASAGFEVLLTRDEDEFLSLKERVAFSEKADLFLSLHIDDLAGAKGVRPIYDVHGAFADESRVFAELMKDALLGTGRLSAVGEVSGKNGYYVLRESSCPAIMLNISEGELANQRDMIVEHISGAIESAI